MTAVGRHAAGYAAAMAEPLQRDRDRASGFARAAWVMLDWAASGFSTVLITLVVAYVERGVFHGGGWGIEAGVIWAWKIGRAHV